MKNLLVILFMLCSVIANSQTLSHNQKHLKNYIDGYLYEDARDMEDVGTPYEVNKVYQSGENCYVYYKDGMYFEISCNHVSMYSSVATKVVITKEYYNKAVGRRIKELTHKWLKKYDRKKITPPLWLYKK